MSRRQSRTTPPRISPVVTPRRTTSRWRSWRRVILGPPGHQAVRRWSYLLLLILICAGTSFYLRITNPERVRQNAEAYFRLFIDADVQIGAAEFSFFHGVHLLGVEIRKRSDNPDDELNPTPPLFVCRDIVLRHDPVAALAGRLVVQEITAVNPSCTLIRSEDDDSFGLKGILHYQGEQQSSDEQAYTLPLVRFREAEMRILARDGSTLDSVENIRLNCLATPVGERGTGYQIDWRSLETPQADGRLLYRLNEQVFTSLSGGLPWVSLEAILMTLDEQIPGAARMCELIGLEGELQARDFHIHPTGTDTMEHMAATIVLRDAALSIPVNTEEEALPRTQRYLRVSNANGKITISPQRCEAVFDADFHDGTCRVDAVLHALPATFEDLRKAAFDVDVSFTNLLLPDAQADEPPGSSRLVNRWKELKDFFRDYDPHGHIDFTGHFSRKAGTDEEIHFDGGKLVGKKCDAAHRFFRYRVRNLVGDVIFSQDGVDIELTGDHDGSPVRVEGRTDSIYAWTPANVFFTGENLVLNDEIYRNLKPRYQRIWDLFSISGRTNVTLRLHRENSTRENWKEFETDIDADLQSVSLRYARFPYPVNELTGTVRIDAEDIELINLKGKAGNGILRASGSASLNGDDLKSMQIDLDAEGLALDEQLFAALPPETRQKVESLSPSGQFDVHGVILHREGDRETGYNLLADLQDVRIHSKVIPVPIHSITGKVYVHPDRAKLEDIRGESGEAKVQVNGLLSDSPDFGSWLDLSTEDLYVDKTLIEKLPPAIRSSLDEFDFEGTVKAHLEYRESDEPESRQTVYNAEIDLNDVAVTWAQFPLPLKQVSGRVLVDPEGVRFEEISAHHEQAVIRLDGGVQMRKTETGNETLAELSLSCNGMGFSEPLRKAVPWRWRRLWNDVKPEGTFNLELPSLRARTQPDGPTDWNIEGLIQLQGVAVDIGTRLENLSGTFRGVVLSTPGDGPMAATGAFDCQRMDLFKKRFENVKGSLTRSGETGRFHLFDIQGTLYGGQVEGQVEWGPDGEDTTYSAAATVSQVEFQPLLQAGRDPGKTPVETGGVLDGRLFLNGKGGAPDSFRTVGVLNVQKARLFSTPLFVEVVRDLNTVQQEELNTQSASAELFIRGDVVEFKDLKLEDSLLAMIGKGTLNRETDALDVLLLAGTPQGGVEVPVLTELLQGTARELVEIHVRGTLDEPEIESRPLRGIDGALRTLFGKDRKQKD